MQGQRGQGRGSARRNPETARNAAGSQPADGTEFSPQVHPRGAGIYPSRLEPAVLPGDYVRIKSTGEIRKVEEMIVQPGVLAFTGGVTVTAGGEETDNELDALELPDNFMGQYRIVHPGVDIPTDIEFTWDFGAANAQTFSTNQQRGFMDHQTATLETEDAGGTDFTSDRLNDQLLEIYSFEQQDIFVTFNHTNGGGAQQTIQDVRFSGFQYKLTPNEVEPSRGVMPEPIPNEPVVPKPGQ